MRIYNAPFHSAGNIGDNKCREDNDLPASGEQYDAIVTTGLYSNMTGTEDIRTKAPVITARGLAAEDIYKRLGKYKAPGVNYLTLLKNESAITADYYLPLRTYISYE
jgi:hypothetical protein